MAFAHDRDPRLGRAKQDDLILFRLAAERRDAPVFALGQAMGGSRQRASMRLRRAAVLRGNNDRRKPAEWRQPAKLPLLGLLRVKPLGVAGLESLDDGVPRLPGLQEGVPGPVAASRAAGRLTKKLERTLGRA